MTSDYSAGGYIEAWCTRCRLELGHTIVAMVAGAPRRVQCNTCNTQHNFRTKPPEKKRTKPDSLPRKRSSRRKDYGEYLSRLSNLDATSARQYTTEAGFEKDEIVDHPRFGRGIVASVIQRNKVEIVFRDGPRLLVQNRGSERDNTA